MHEHMPSPVRILSAEDVDLNREMLRFGLTRLGHEVEFAVNGAEAVDKLQSLHFDLVLMDVQMPVMDGVEATRRIRQLPAPSRNIPVIGLTANVAISELRAYVSAGMNECLGKPIDWPRLAAAISLYSSRDVILNNSQIESLRVVMGDAQLGDLQFRALDSLQGLADSFAAHHEISGVMADAHKAKGLAATLGMSAIHQTAAAIHSAAAEGRRETAAMDRLQQDIRATRQALAAAGITV